MSGPPRKAAPGVPTARVLCVAIAQYEYNATENTELGFPEGARLNVLQREGDWWRGEFQGQVGWFPKQFVKEVSGSSAASASNQVKVTVGEDFVGGTGQAPSPSAMQSAIHAQIKQMSDEVTNGIKVLYKQFIRPVEVTYKFGEFANSPPWEDADFDAPPMVVMLGQYSVGKTTFIRYLLERDFPGQRIGPEPTTDRFCAIMHSPQEKIIPGQAAAMDVTRPFRALQRFGSGFLNKFELVMCPSPILESIYFIDTPGVLSGEKQRIGRSYQFPQVIEWFAARSDRILLLFDAHKLDISDEFSDAIKMLKGHDDKIRVVLNKCDLVTNQQLMRVYGALMWSLGKVVNTPEVLRVYVGSFWDQPYADPGKSNTELFDREANDLLSDLRSLPRNSAIRKINELIKRCRQSKTHALLVSHLKSKMPGWFGKEKKQQKMLDNLVDEFREVQRKYSLPPGDFPNVQRFREQLQGGGYTLDKFPSLKAKMIEQMDHVLSVEIPTLMRRLPGIEALKSSADVVDAKDAANPFAASGSMNSAHAGKAWVISGPQKASYDNVFETLQRNGDKATGASCRQTMINSGLDQGQLGKVWTLSDIDQDGCLDRDEFALCMYLMESVAAGQEVPTSLPKNFIPPSKRNT